MPWFTKKIKKKASFGFSDHIQGRFRPFPACFSRISRQPIRPDMADTAPFWPNQPGLVWIEANLARIEPCRCKLSWVSVNLRKKKKKKTQTRTDARATASDAASRSDSGAAPLVPHLCFLAPHLPNKSMLQIRHHGSPIVCIVFFFFGKVGDIIFIYSACDGKFLEKCICSVMSCPIFGIGQLQSTLLDFKFKQKKRKKRENK